MEVPEMVGDLIKAPTKSLQLCS